MFEKVRLLLSKYFERHPAAKRTAAWLRKRRKMLLTWFFIFAHLAGALTSVRAIMEVRTAQGAIAWTVALNTVPYVSVTVQAIAPCAVRTSIIEIGRAHV